MKICLAIPERFSAQKELPVLLQKAADVTVFPEGFLRSEEDIALSLRLSAERDGVIIAGYRDRDFEKAVAIESGRVVDEYTKCILTSGEKERKRPGERIRCLDTGLGKIAVPICYEVHFPEVCRIMALEGPELMVNIIGTGMYHRLQYDQWRALARARAIENELPVVGCCHFCGEIPLAFAFGSNGEPLLEIGNRRGAFTVEISLTKERPIGYLDDRKPGLFAPLTVE